MKKAFVTVRLPSEFHREIRFGQSLTLIKAVGCTKKKKLDNCLRLNGDPVW